MIKNYKKTSLGEEFWCESSTFIYIKPLLYRRYLIHLKPKNIHPISYNETDYRWHPISGVEKDLVLSEFFNYKREQKLNRICDEQR